MFSPVVLCLYFSCSSMMFLFRWCHTDWPVRCPWVCAWRSDGCDTTLKIRNIDVPCMGLRLRCRWGLRARSPADAVGMRGESRRTPLTPYHWRGWVRSWLRRPPPVAPRTTSMMMPARRGGGRVFAGLVWLSKTGEGPK